MPTKAKKTEVDLDEYLKQIFRDLLDDGKQAAAFARLEQLEAMSNVHYLPEPKKPIRKKKPTKAMIRRVFELYREYETEIKAILDLGGQAATALVTILLRQPSKPKLPASVQTS